MLVLTILMRLDVTKQKDDTCSFSRHPGKMAWKGTDPSWSLPLELPRQGLRIPELYRNCGQVPHWFTKNSAHPYYRQGDPLALPLPQASVEILVHNHHPRAVSGFKVAPSPALFLSLLSSFPCGHLMRATSHSTLWQVVISVSTSLFL